MHDDDIIYFLTLFLYFIACFTLGIASVNVINDILTLILNR
jgi:hypothetical protein